MTSDPEINTPGMLRKELDYFIESAIDAHPRSQQEQIGPSEIGTPCTRKLGHKLAGTAPVNTVSDGWRATVGTAVHAWLAGMLERANTMLGQRRFLVEHTVTPGEIGNDEFDGSCDCYDTETDTVVDWKIVGPTSLKRVKTHGPSVTYRTQLHAYARGWQREGKNVKHVAIYTLPAAGDFRQASFWSEPYDETVATQAIQRVSDVHSLVHTGGRSVLGLLPTADDHCSHCPYYQPNARDLTVACPGDPGRLQRTDSFAGLIPATQNRSTT